MVKIKENNSTSRNSLKKVVLPEGLTEIGPDVFTGCVKLEEIVLERFAKIKHKIEQLKKELKAQEDHVLKLIQAKQSILETEGLTAGEKVYGGLDQDIMIKYLEQGINLFKLSIKKYELILMKNDLEKMFSDKKISDEEYSYKLAIMNLDGAIAECTTYKNNALLTIEASDMEIMKSQYLLKRESLSEERVQKDVVVETQHIIAAREELVESESKLQLLNNEKERMELSCKRIIGEIDQATFDLELKKLEEYPLEVRRTTIK